MQQLQNIIETAFERRAEITPANADTVTREAVNQVIAPAGFRRTACSGKN